jgi:sigma-E factor negative regulatory protein RseC
METETGIVVELDGDEAVLQIQLSGKCSQCSSRAPCSAVGPNIRQISVRNIMGARVGERVEISFPPRARVLSAFLFFLFPVLLALIGFFLGQAIGGGEGSGVVGTFAGFVLAYVVVRLLNPLIERRKRVPTMRRIVAREEDPGQG